MSLLDPLRDRAVLLDLLRPPSGCRIERIIGTTYTLDLESLIAVCLVLTDLPWDEDTTGDDRLAPLVAVRRAVTAAAADRRQAPVITLACHAGAIHMPRGMPDLAPWLEEMVVPVLPSTAGGIFHPKVWLVRWRDPRGNIGWHALIGSRNCTGDRRWDVGMRLEGRPNGHRRRESRGLAALVRAIPILARHAGTMIAPAHDRALRKDADELERFSFHLPEDDTAVPIAVHGLTDPGTGSQAFSGLRHAAITRLLVMSPFVDKGFLARVRSRSGGAPMTVISTSANLQQLGPCQPGVDARELRDLSLNTDGTDTPGDGIAIPPANDRLHAKLVFLEHGRHVRVLMGSANATLAAWGDDLTGDGRNIELTAILDGPQSRYGISQTLKTWEDLLVQHLPLEPSVLASVDRLMEERLRIALTAVVAAQPVVTWRAERGSWSARLRFAHPVHITPRVLVSVKPLSQGAEQARPLHRTTRDLVWSTGSLAQVTAWFAVRLSTQQSGRTLSWERVLLVPFAGATPTLIAQRNAAALQALIGNGDALVRFLLLTARSQGDPTGLRHRQGMGDSATTRSHALSLQDILRASADPDDQRFEELDDIIRSTAGLKGTALPPGFPVVWDAVRAARKLMR